MNTYREHYLCVRPGFLGRAEVVGYSLWSVTVGLYRREHSRTTQLRSTAEIRRWAKRHGISEEEVRTAVEALGS